MQQVICAALLDPECCYVLAFLVHLCYVRKICVLEENLELMGWPLGLQDVEVLSAFDGSARANAGRHAPETQHGAAWAALPHSANSG